MTKMVELQGGGVISSPSVWLAKDIRIAPGSRFCEQIP